MLFTGAAYGQIMRNFDASHLLSLKVLLFFTAGWPPAEVIAVAR